MTARAPVCGSWRRYQDQHGFLAAQQREADLQASRWIEREVIGLLHGRDAFSGNRPRLTYTRGKKLATMSHGAA